MERSGHRRLWLAAPAVAALLVYLSTLGAGFVYDDHAVIESNRWVKDSAVWKVPAKPLLDLPGVGSTNYYRPVPGVLYNLAWRSLGGKPIAFHLLNVLLHMVNATLLMLLLRRVSGAEGLLPIGAGILFALHPLNTEVVAWPSCFPELCYVAFGLSALLAHATGRSINACLLFGLACASKETAVVFLPLIVLLDLWRPSPSRRVLGIAPYLGVAALYLLARTIVLGGLIPPRAHGLRTAWDAILNAPLLLLLYVKQMVVPVPLLVQHVVSLVTSPADPRFLGGLGVLGVAAAAVWRVRRTRPDLAFAACLIVIPLLPALYLPGLGRDPYAERYAYLGVAGFCWLLVGGLGLAARRAPTWAFPVVVYALCIAAAATTARRCGDWHDDGTLGAASMRDEPRAAVGYLLRGDWLKREVRAYEAWQVYQAGLMRVPESVELQQDATGLGMELGHLTRDQVMATFERLVPLTRDSAPSQFNLGASLLGGGRLDAAQAAFARALELSPESAPSMTALGTIAMLRGDARTAIDWSRRALSIDPDLLAARRLLGFALLRSGDAKGAIEALERVVREDPKDTEARDRLAEAYRAAG